jgi:hypothetical protein
MIILSHTIRHKISLSGARIVQGVQTFERSSGCCRRSTALQFNMSWWSRVKICVTLVREINAISFEHVIKLKVQLQLSAWNMRELVTVQCSLS